MKKKILLFALICAAALFLSAYLHAKSSDTPPGGQIVYRSLEINEPDNLIQAGVNLSKYNYVKVYQYALVESKSLFVFGRMKTGKIRLLSISFDGGNSLVVAEYPPSLSRAMTKARFTIFFMQKLKPSLLPFILIEYKGDDEITYIDVFYGDKEFKLIKQEKIPRAKIFLSDANNDGYTDILVWKSMNYKENNEVILNGELFVMFFRSESMAFSELTPLRTIKFDSSSL